MKIATAIVLCLLTATSRLSTAADDPSVDGLAISILSFNIRYGTANDGENAWPHRKEMVYEVLRDRKSDFVGLQEALRFQIDAIREAVPGYGEVGVGRDDGKEAGEYSAILYKSDRWQAQESGTFWLSDTPDVPGSTSWGNQVTRIVTWGRFVEKVTGMGVWVFNAHFDHVSQRSREKSAELLAVRLARPAPYEPVIVTGDFNAGEDNPAIRLLKGATGRSPVALVDTFRVLHANADDVGTRGGFEGRRSGAKIDYIFVEASASVQVAEIIHDHRDGRYPSDHFPVYAEVVLPKP